MAKQVARQRGDDYQAFLFWLFAARMLRSTSKIIEVGFEVSKYKSLDELEMADCLLRQCVESRGLVEKTKAAAARRT